MQLNTENARRNTPHNEKPMLPVEIKRLHGNVFACDHGSFAEWKFPSSLPQQLPLRPALQCGQKFNFLIWRCWGCPTHCVSPFRFLSFLPSFFLSFLPSFLLPACISSAGQGFSNSNHQTGFNKRTRYIQYVVP